MHMTKTVVAFLFFHAVGKEIKELGQATEIHEFITVNLGIQMPPLLTNVKKEKEFSNERQNFGD
jgi:hypothetical protein